MFSLFYRICPFSTDCWQSACTGVFPGFMPGVLGTVQISAISVYGYALPGPSCTSHAPACKEHAGINGEAVKASPLAHRRFLQARYTLKTGHFSIFRIRCAEIRTHANRHTGTETSRSGDIPRHAFRHRPRPAPQDGTVVYCQLTASREIQGR